MIGSDSLKAPSLNQSEANSFFARRIYFTALCTGHVCCLCILIEWFPVLVRLDRSITLSNLYSNFLPSGYLYGYFALKLTPEFIPVIFSKFSFHDNLTALHSLTFDVFWLRIEAIRLIRNAFILCLWLALVSGSWYVWRVRCSVKVKSLFLMKPRPRWTWKLMSSFNRRYDESSLTAQCSLLLTGSSPSWITIGKNL